VIERLGTKDVPIGELSFFPGNARRGNIPKIRAALRRLGQFRDVVVRVADGQLVILAGNHTVKAMRAEDFSSVWCELIRCTDDEARRVNLADNKISDEAADDRDALLEILSDLDGDYEGTGWAEEDVNALMTPSGDPVPDDELPAPDESRTLAVVVVCDSEIDQRATAEDLRERGYDARAVRLGDTVLRDAR
jgi:ParB-like chromosome segregation protein Spo0J